MKTKTFAAGLALAFSTLSSGVFGADTFTPDFTDFASNYQKTYPGASEGTVTADGQDWSLSSTSGNASYFFVHDTTPDATASTLFGNVTINVDFSLSTAGSSLGIYFGNGGIRSSSLLLLLNLDSPSAGGNDTIRFFSGVSMNSSAITSVLDTDTFTSDGYTVGNRYSFSLTVDYLGEGQVDASYTLFDPTGQLASVTGSYTYAGIEATEGEIGFRTYQAGPGTLGISASQIPEPSAWALFAGAAGLALVISRRRGR